jgi:hypothetical protein
MVRSQWPEVRAQGRLTFSERSRNRVPTIHVKHRCVATELTPRIAQSSHAGTTNVTPETLPGSCSSMSHTTLGYPTRSTVGCRHITNNAIVSSQRPSPHWIADGQDWLCRPDRSRFTTRSCLATRCQAELQERRDPACGWHGVLRSIRCRPPGRRPHLVFPEFQDGPGSTTHRPEISWPSPGNQSSAVEVARFIVLKSDHWPCPAPDERRSGSSPPRAEGGGSVLGGAERPQVQREGTAPCRVIMPARTLAGSDRARLTAGLGGRHRLSVSQPGEPRRLSSARTSTWYCTASPCRIESLRPSPSCHSPSAQELNRARLHRSQR